MIGTEGTGSEKLFGEVADTVCGYGVTLMTLITLVTLKCIIIILPCIHICSGSKAGPANNASKQRRLSIQLSRRLSHTSRSSSPSSSNDPKSHPTNSSRESLLPRVGENQEEKVRANKPVAPVIVKKPEPLDFNRALKVAQIVLSHYSHWRVEEGI